MQRCDHFRERHPAFRQPFGGANSVDRVPVHVAVDQMPGGAGEGIFIEIVEFLLPQRPVIAEMDDVKLVPVADYLVHALEYHA